MDNISVTISNYRNISDNNPITIEICKGITFILGVNNIGKSNLLKFFYEFRESSPASTTGSSTGGGKQFTPRTLLYSNIKNHNSTENEINFELTYKGYSYVYKISPHNSSNLDEPYYSQQRRNKNEDYASNDKVEMFSSLFDNSMYIGAFRTPMFQATADYYDIQIGHSFIKIWDEWANGSNNTKANRKIRALKKELKDLFGYNHFDIYPNQHNTNFRVETDDGTFNLDELGAGISHFIIVLANAMIQEPSFIFIDEPENGLHPKMQELFVRTLASKAKYGLIATSHSIGLARSVGADKIYSLSKDKNKRLTLSLYGDNYHRTIIDSINELGYSQFAELGGNNILLVEGTTDIKAFKEILRKYCIDQHFIVMDLGGSNLINGKRFDELNELKRLNANSFSVIFDSEISNEGEVLKQSFQDFIAICESLGFNTFYTEVHSSDNYVTQDAINKVIGPHINELNKFEALKSRSKEDKWEKNLNWKLFHEMSKSDFDKTKLGEFITNVLVPKTVPSS